MKDFDRHSEIRNATRKENWSLTGSNRVVKVVPLNWSSLQSTGGYITLARYLHGKTPPEIEKHLGLPSGFLSCGACIYSLTRLPNPSEYDYELTAKFPDGLAYNPAHGDPRYAPGSAQTHQWQIKSDVKIPVNLVTAVKLMPNERFLWR